METVKALVFKGMDDISALSEEIFHDVRERIEEKLRAAFQPVFLEVWMKAIVTMSQPALKAILKLCGQRSFYG